MWTLDTFYHSKEWQNLRRVVLNERTKEDGFVYDEITGKPIVKAYDAILHHTVFLTEENVNDREISLNPDLIQIVSHKTHNLIHEKLGYVRKEIYLVYGAPFAGADTWAQDNAGEGDLIVNIDDIWQCVSGLPRYHKPARLNAVVFGVRDYLMECVKTRRGKWNNALICGGFPLISERERICRTYGAREVYVEATREECEARINAALDGELRRQYVGYLDEWWRRFAPTEYF